VPCWDKKKTRLVCWDLAMQKDVLHCPPSRLRLVKASYAFLVRLIL
jgi:hypothetical protein